MQLLLYVPNLRYFFVLFNVLTLISASPKVFAKVFRIKLNDVFNRQRHASLLFYL